LRFKITLTPEKGAIKLPYSYNYHLASTIYSFLGKSSPSFSEFLHQEGYRHEDKTFKLFTFSPLLATRRKALEHEIVLMGRLEWLISSPKDVFLSHLVDGILNVGHFSLLRQKLMIEQVEVMEPPLFYESIFLRVLIEPWWN
jgi:CRISPR-associated endoribonuclease Cas6